MNDKIRRALETDMLIDIITTGAKTGLPRETEIWFMNIEGRIIICGTPDADGRRGRDWLANMKANPQFLFCLKESVKAQLRARAVPIVDPEDRRRLMTAPETRWYREQGNTIEEIVEYSPIVEVVFED
ncbi:MAG: nitroreductase/quinone reductase family protein [Chloroflexota bacterium]